VTRGQVRITDAQGILIGAGEAVQQANPADWIYTIKVASASITGQLLQVMAMDRPGNKTEAEQVIS